MGLWPPWSTRASPPPPAHEPSLPREALSALRRIEITARRLANTELSGSYTSVFRGRGLAFSEVRLYQPGDDVRAIDWNVSARMRETYIKVFVEEREITVMLLVDVSASGLFSSVGATKRALAAEVAAACAFSAVEHGDRVGLVLASDRVERVVPPRKGRKHAMRVVREILGARPVGAGTDLRAPLEALRHVARRRAVAFLLSDFQTRGYERALALAASRHDVIPIALVDPRDDALPDVGLVELEDFETGEVVAVDTGSRAVRAAWARAARLRREEWTRTCRRLGLDHAVVRTDAPYVRPLRELFLARARRTHR